MGVRGVAACLALVGCAAGRTVVAADDCRARFSFQNVSPGMTRAEFAKLHGQDNIRTLMAAASPGAAPETWLIVAKTQGWSLRARFHVPSGGPTARDPLVAAALEAPESAHSVATVLSWFEERLGRPSAAADKSAAGDKLEGSARRLVAMWLDAACHSRVKLLRRLDSKHNALVVVEVEDLALSGIAARPPPVRPGAMRVPPEPGENPAYARPGAVPR